MSRRGREVLDFMRRRSRKKYDSEPGLPSDDYPDLRDRYLKMSTECVSQPENNESTMLHAMPP